MVYLGLINHKVLVDQDQARRLHLHAPFVGTPAMACGFEHANNLLQWAC